jgi:hypothetical protein
MSMSFLISTDTMLQQHHREHRSVGSGGSLGAVLQIGMSYFALDAFVTAR